MRYNGAEIQFDEKNLKEVLRVMEGPIQWRSLQRDLRGFEIIGVERQIDGLHRLHKSRLSKGFVS